MPYQDGITFADEVEAYQPFYPFGLQEDLMAVHSMSAQGKQSQYEVFDVNQYDHNSGAQYLPQSYESPLTDQNDLAALPSGYGAEYDEGLYFHTQTDQYAPGTVVPSTSAPYSTTPMTASAPVYSQPTTYHQVQTSKKRKVSVESFDFQPQAEHYAPSTAAPSTSALYSTGPLAASAPVQTQSVSYHSMQPSKKRKASVESFDGEAPRPKRITLGLQDPNGEFYDLKSESSPYSSLVPTPTTITNFHMPQHAVSPRLMGHHHSTSNVSQMSVAATAPYTPTISPSFTTANTEQSPHAPATPGPRSASAASNHPRLVRTSTMPQQSPRPTSTMAMVGHTQNFNPYHLYSPDSKARLHLEGSLDDVAKVWSEEHLESRRKIVVFERDQKGNDIYTNFKVVSPEDWKNHSPSVSCIWWEEKKEAYVTSVDTISLLEGIVAARFTVEEKNRIRRNLEGFKPDTVSKAKPDTEEFFKVIMGFPNPKPRNIEKDVKVFPWKVLSVALQKIISKYSASYASTAASIPSHKHFRQMEHPAEFRYSHSPAPEYHISTPQMASFPTYEPQIRVPIPMPMHAVANVQVAPQVSYGHEGHAAYGYGHLHVHPQQAQHQHQSQQHQQLHQQQPVQYQQAPMAGPPVTQQQFWHYGYNPEGQMPMAPASAPSTAYPREMLDAGDYRHVPYAVHATHH